MAKLNIYEIYCNPDLKKKIDLALAKRAKIEGRSISNLIINILVRELKVKP